MAICHREAKPWRSSRVQIRNVFSPRLLRCRSQWRSKEPNDALYPLHFASQWGDGLSADHFPTENSLSQAQKHPEGFSLIYLIAQTLARVQASVSFPSWTIPFTSTLPGRVVFGVLIASPLSALMRKTPSLAGVKFLLAPGLTRLSLQTKVFFLPSVYLIFAPATKLFSPLTVVSRPQIVTFQVQEIWFCFQTPIKLVLHWIEPASPPAITLFSEFGLIIWLLPPKITIPVVLFEILFLSPTIVTASFPWILLSVP